MLQRINFAASFTFEIKEGTEGRSHGGERKQDRDWITGWLTRLCVLLSTVMVYFKGMLTQMSRNMDRVCLR